MRADRTLRLGEDARQLRDIVGTRLRRQVALGGRQLRAPHHVLDGDEVELLNCQAADGVSQIVEAPYSDTGLFLGVDEAAADGGAIERGAVRSAEGKVGVAREPRPLPAVPAVPWLLARRGAPCEGVLRVCPVWTGEDNALPIRPKRM